MYISADYAIIRRYNLLYNRLHNLLKFTLSQSIVFFVIMYHLELTSKPYELNLANSRVRLDHDRRKDRPFLKVGCGDVMPYRTPEGVVPHCSRNEPLSQPKPDPG
jgi:hypothetical protein